jgi:hypothetical protein
MIPEKKREIKSNAITVLLKNRTPIMIKTLYRFLTDGIVGFRRKFGTDPFVNNVITVIIVI